MLEGPSIRLRLIADGDVEELIQLTNQIIERGEYLSSRLFVESPFRKKLSDTGMWEDNEGSMVFTDKAGRLIGHMGFFEGMKHEDGYELGYSVLRKEDRGKGYGTEALRIFSAYLFDLKPIARLHIKTDVRNEASRRIAEKCGYKLEGRFAKFAFCRGEHVDLEVYSLLRENCPPLSEALQGGS